MAQSANPGQAPRLLRNVSFMLMWASVAASGFGDRLIQLVAWTMLGIEEPDADGSSIQAAVYFFFFLPYLVFSPLGGWLADTLPRKWIMFACDEIRALIMVLAFLLVPAGAARAIPEEHVLFSFELAGTTFTFYGRSAVYWVIFGVGVMAAIFNPTRNATVPQIVRTEDLQGANAIILGLAVIASLIGMLVGGVLIDAFDSLRAGLFVAVAAFAVSGTFFIFLRIRGRPHTPPEQRPSQLRRLVQGVSYIARHKPVMQLVVLGMLFWAASHVLVAAIAALNVEYYPLPSPLIAAITGEAEQPQLILHLAVMNAVLGLGMLTTALVVSFFNTRREAGLVINTCLLLTGVFVLLLGLSRSFEWGLVMAFCVGFFGNAMVVYVNSQTQAISPNFIRGRVFGVREIFGTIAAVSVNLLIWQIPGTDLLMVPTLYALAAFFVVLAVIDLGVVLTRGPLDTRAANGLWHFVRAYVTIWHRLEMRGRHHIPATGGVILASNHTTALDPMLIQTGARRKVRWLMLDAFRFRILEPLWRVIHPITIEPSRKQFARFRQVAEALKAGDVVGMFPEGGLQRTHRELQRFHPGIAMIAQRSGAPIVPVWIAGTPRRRTMILHFLQPSRSRIVFGRPYYVDPDADHDAIIAELRRRMLELADESDA